MNETISTKTTSSPETTLSAGAKRKRNAEPKFYAVRSYIFPFLGLGRELTVL